MKKILTAAAPAAVLLAAVLAAAGGVLRWDIAAVIAAISSCAPVILSFEKRRTAAGELVLIAVMTAFSVAGRFVFAVIPFFKPVTAIVIITAMYLGAQAGFMTGAMSALISNIYFGQGVWTPFQMFCWGFLGFAAGLLNRKKLLEKPVILCVYGVLAGAAYSVIMDVWTTLSADGTFSAERWGTSMIASLPVTAVYCVSNVVFLLILLKPVGKRLERLKTKYGLFDEKLENRQT